MYTTPPAMSTATLPIYTKHLNSKTSRKMSYKLQHSRNTQDKILLVHAEFLFKFKTASKNAPSTAFRDS